MVGRLPNGSRPTDFKIKYVSRKYNFLLKIITVINYYGYYYYIINKFILGWWMFISFIRASSSSNRFETYKSKSLLRWSTCLLNDLALLQGERKTP